MVFLPDLSIGGHPETTEHKVDKGFDIPRMTKEEIFFVFQLHSSKYSFTFESS